MAIERLRINERSSRTVTFYLKDNLGNPIPAASLDSLTLTLYDIGTFAPDSGSPSDGIINARNGQDVLNANNVTVHASSGLVTWAMQPEDNIIVTLRRQIERHRAEFVPVANGVELDYQFEIEVLNLRKAS